jgi:hypothetical protein
MTEHQHRGILKSWAAVLRTYHAEYAVGTTVPGTGEETAKLAPFIPSLSQDDHQI